MQFLLKHVTFFTVVMFKKVQNSIKSGKSVLDKIHESLLINLEQKRDFSCDVG